MRHIYAPLAASQAAQPLGCVIIHAPIAKEVQSDAVTTVDFSNLCILAQYRDADSDTFL